METSILIGIWSAFWFGILTSISPCPLATNIAAVSFIGRGLKNPSQIFFSGILYTAGRMSSYTILGILIVKSFMAVFDLAKFMQTYTNQALGIILFIVGLTLLNIIKIPSFSGNLTEKLSERFASWGIFGSFFLGILFALSFCPISAALFFGSLIPIALKFQSSILIPSMFGIGTALPVLFFAIALGVGSNLVAKAFDKITVFEKWIRIITGIIFISVGVYYIYLYIIAPKFM